MKPDLRRPCTPSHPAKSAPHHRDFAGTPGSRGRASAVLAYPSTDGLAAVLGARPLFWGTWTPNLSASYRPTLPGGAPARPGPRGTLARMRVLITGAAGQLGSDLRRLLPDADAPDRHRLSVTDRAAVAAAVPGHDLVLNCAAYNAVDAAESDPETAFAVNAEAPGSLAVAC